MTQSTLKPALKPTPPRPPKLSAPLAKRASQLFVPSNAMSVPSVLLMGVYGTGKTDSIITLLEAGLKVRAVLTEGNGVEVLIDSIQRRAAKKPDLDISNLAWHQVSPSTLDIKTMMSKIGLSNRNGAGELQQMESGLERFKYRQFTELLKTMNDFIDDRTGESLGNIASWGDDTALVLDSMTGMNRMIIQHVCGHRPTMTQPEYGIVQNHIMDLIYLLTSLRCFFVMTAHLEKEVNPMTGAKSFMVSTVGKAIAPDVPIPFSEVVLTKQENGSFSWSTLDNSALLKRRTLPLKESIEPSFVPLVEAYRARKRATENREQQTAEETNSTQ